MIEKSLLFFMLVVFAFVGIYVLKVSYIDYSICRSAKSLKEDYGLKLVKWVDDIVVTMSPLEFREMIQVEKFDLRISGLRVKDIGVSDGGYGVPSISLLNRKNFKVDKQIAYWEGVDALGIGTSPGHGVLIYLDNYDERGTGRIDSRPESQEYVKWKDRIVTVCSDAID